MTPGTLALTLYRGSTFGPVVLTGLDVNNNPVDLSGFTPHAKVRVGPNKPVILDLVPIMSNAAVGEITIPAISDEATKSVPHGDYVWDLLLERSNGEVLGPFLAGPFVAKTAISRA